MASHSEQPPERVPQASESFKWPALPVVDQSKSKPLSICIVSPEFNGPQRNGGIGTFYTALGEALAETGHNVTFLHTIPERITELQEKWSEDLSQRNIRFDTIDMDCVKSVNSSRAIGHSYACYQYLKSRRFDVVQIPDWLGFGYYSLLAKRQGLTLQDTMFVVGAFGSEIWLREGNGEQVHDLDTLVFDFMERQCLALADVVVSHSHFMLNEQIKRDAVIAKKAYVQANLLTEGDIKGGRGSPSSTRVKIDEIVFTGRLEERKGLRLFCDAIDKSIKHQTISADTKITFLGKSRWIDNCSAFEFIKRRSKNWLVEPLILSKLNHEEAFEYLAAGNRLAVVPSLKDNIPYTLVSCIARGIPVIASDVGGVREVIVEELQDEVLFAPRVDALVSKLEESLSKGVRVAVLSFVPSDNKVAWVRWHDGLLADASITENKLRQPLVSICIPHYDSPQTLKQAIASIEEQDYPNIEVVLVDDGSPSQIAQDYLNELEETFAQRKWVIKRQENKYLGAARNEAARLASGEYLLFMDHDNIAKKSEVSTFVKAALNTGADVLTCAYDVFSGESLESLTYLHTYVPLGAAISSGLYKNFYGDANALVKKEAFVRLGGFTEDYGIWGEDWEFFAHAALNGAKFEMVPEPLFWYREHPQSMHHSTSVGPGRHRALRPYLEAVPTELRAALMLAITNIDLSVKPLAPLPKSEYAKPEEDSLTGTLTETSTLVEKVEQPEPPAGSSSMSVQERSQAATVDSVQKQKSTNNVISKTVLFVKQVCKLR
ncbi:MAG: glycosyltransferase [Candidatus Obscuribacterales bacterium]|nr:glycosyltransferase [Candidatus Obscuribacterales bacterium]